MTTHTPTPAEMLAERLSESLRRERALTAERDALRARLESMALCAQCRCRNEHPQPCHCENDE